ncbi:MAG TPA: PilZ domain-containing protein [Pyrinomonadaceae bacterium]|nr:PilZ domain-containing protein [Pyrinomonadaceae bacterium]
MSGSKPPSPPDGAGGTERRSATRYAAQLDARLLFQLSVVPDDAPTPAGTGEGEGGAHGNGNTPASTLRLVGHTRNISETGLAFIVPTLRIGDQFAHVIGSRLRIILYLPSGHVEIRATPVRYERLPPEDTERGYLIGVRIAEMADDEWVRVVEYVRTLR